MAKCRVYYRADGTAGIVYPIEKQKVNETESQWLKRVYEKTEVHKQGLPFDDIDASQLPQDANGKKVDREKWRGNQGQGVSIDGTIVTDTEKRKAIEDRLDTELAKPTPNAIAAMRLQRKLDKREYD